MKLLTVALAAAATYAALTAYGLSEKVTRTESQNNLLWGLLLASDARAQVPVGAADDLMARMRAERPEP